MEETGSRMVGGSFHKQGNSPPASLILGCKTRSPHSLVRIFFFFSLSLVRILAVYTEALMEFSHLDPPDGLNIFLSQGYILGMAPSAGRVGSVHIPKEGKGKGPLIAQVQLWGQPVAPSSQ